MHHRLILKVTKFQLFPPKRFKHSDQKHFCGGGGGGALWPQCQIVLSLIGA